jgi:hypothetical protein
LTPIFGCAGGAPPPIPPSAAETPVSPRARGPGRPPKAGLLLWPRLGARDPIAYCCSIISQWIGILLLERFATPGSQDRSPNGAERLSQNLSNLCGSFVAQDGSQVAWRGEDGAVPRIRVAVSPVRPGHSVSLDLRVDGGPISGLVAAPDWGAPASGERVYQAILPQAPKGAL